MSDEQPSRLLQLPDEVKLEIVKQIDRRRDLYNLSLTCRELEDMTLGRLYKSVDLDIPASECPKEMQDTLPTFRPYVLQNMRELAIRNGLSNVNSPIYHKRTRSDANSMEGYVGEIFKAVPQDRLKSFSFLHQKPMSSRMLNDLTKSHDRGLKHFQCCELELLSNSDASLPTNLRSIECRSVVSGEAIAKLIALNKDTLTSLSLGQDKHLLQQYRQRRIGFLNSIAQPCEAFQNTLDLTSIPKLKHLSLSGLDLTTIIPQTQESALFLAQLQSLTLESCQNTAGFLDVLTETFTHIHPAKPSLSKFSFRHELVTTPLKNSMLSFLTSFTTLTSLTLLIENSTFTTRPSAFLKPHGSNLKHLVLESRIQPREHLHIDTSRPFGSSAPQSLLWLDMLSDICTSCPNLVELGTALPWADAKVHASLSQLSALAHLKTLHVRNFPSSPTQLKLGEARIRDHAVQLLERCFPASSQSTLETLAIGPTLYTSRWRLGQQGQTQTQTQTQTQPQTGPVSTTASDTEDTTPRERFTASMAKGRAAKKQKKNYHAPPEHLCTHYFTLTAEKNLCGVSERAMEEIRGSRGLGGVFEPVWLR